MTPHNPSRPWHHPSLAWRLHHDHEHIMMLCMERKEGEEIGEKSKRQQQQNQQQQKKKRS